MIHQENELRNKSLDALIEWWVSETQHISSITEIARHPANRAIQGVGRDALDYLAHRLEMYLEDQRIRDSLEAHTTRGKTITVHFPDQPVHHLIVAVNGILGTGPEIPTNHQGRPMYIAEHFLRRYVEWCKEHGHFKTVTE